MRNLFAMTLASVLSLRAASARSLTPAEAAKAAGPVALSLDVPAGPNPDVADEVLAAEKIIYKLLGPGAARDFLAGPKSDETVIRYSADQWSAQVTAQERESLLSGLVSSWGKYIVIEAGSGASQSSSRARSAAEGVSLDEEKLAAKALSAVPGAILQGDSAAGYDGAAQRSGDVAVAVPPTSRAGGASASSTSATARSCATSWRPRPLRRRSSPPTGAR